METIGDFVIVRLFNTDDWDSEWLRESHVHRCWNQFVFNRNIAVRVCELTPSYELHSIDAGFEFEEGFEPDDSERDRIDEEFRESCWSDPVIYVHCSDIDALSNNEDQYFIHGTEGTEDEGETIEALIEHYSGNPHW